jgi:hypothetical protein
MPHLIFRTLPVLCPDDQRQDSLSGLLWMSWEQSGSKADLFSPDDQEGILVKWKASIGAWLKDMDQVDSFHTGPFTFPGPMNYRH